MLSQHKRASFVDFSGVSNHMTSGIVQPSIATVDIQMIGNFFDEVVESGDAPNSPDERLRPIRVVSISPNINLRCSRLVISVIHPVLDGAVDFTSTSFVQLHKGNIIVRVVDTRG